MKKYMFCLVMADSHKFKSNYNNYARIKTIDGELLVPLVTIEGTTLKKLKSNLNKTVTEFFEKMQKKTKAKIDKPRIQKEKTKHVNQNSEVENSTTQVRWPMEW